MGIIHKDLSPGNILQAASGVWYLTNFDISAICKETSA
jgi:serine/threonine protein kinase